MYRNAQPRSKPIKSRGLEPAGRSLRVGDCLYTVDGEAAIESIKRVATAAGAETYTVALEGGSGAEMLAVGGVFTHTKAAFTTAMLKEHLKVKQAAMPGFLAKAARGHGH